MKFKPPKTKEIKKEAKSPIKKNVSRWQWYLIVSIVLTPLLSMLWIFFSDKFFIEAKGTIVTNSYVIKAPTDAYVEKSLLRIGKPVKKKDSLIWLDSPEINAKYDSVIEQLEHIRGIQERIKNNDLEYLQKKYESSKEYVSDSREFYNGIKKFRAKKLVNIFDLQQSREILHRAEMELMDITVQIAVSKEDYISNENSNILKELRTKELDKSVLEARKKDLEIKAKADGVVNSVFVYDGEFVQKGQSLAVLSLSDAPYIKAYLDSKYISYAHQDDEVTIRFGDGKKFLGKIENVPVFAERRKGSIFSGESSGVVLIVVPEEPVPNSYVINGAPVYIDVDRL